MNRRNTPHVSSDESAAALVAALHNPALYPHPVARVELIETHIATLLRGLAREEPSA